MTRSKEIRDELKELGSQLEGTEIATPFQVPAGYFDNLAVMVLLRIKTENIETAREETEILSPLLGGLAKKTPFSVPEGYFQQLTPNIKIKELPKEEKSARVISMSGRNVWKYAAAAVTVGLITVIAWFFIKTPGQENNQYAANEHVSTEKQVQEKISKATDVEILQFINADDLQITDQPADGDVLNDEDLPLMLADISDQDLENYLTQHNSVKEKFN